jgi:hypothetical protein
MLNRSRTSSPARLQILAASARAGIITIRDANAALSHSSSSITPTRRSTQSSALAQSRV